MLKFNRMGRRYRVNINDENEMRPNSLKKLIEKRRAIRNAKMGVNISK